jgi:hypothetical protein
MEDDYNDLIRQAAMYREMADNDDGDRRRMLLGVVQDLEAKARNLLRQSEQTDPGKK